MGYALIQKVQLYRKIIVMNVSKNDSINIE